MAAVTLLGTATFTTASGTKTVTATPAVGDLIVIVVAHSGSTSSVAPTDNNSSGTYTLINSAVKATSADTMRVYVRNSLIASAASTVFTHAPGTTSGGGLAVLKITGMTRVGSAAVRGSGIQSNQAAATTPAPVLSLTPLTVNAIITAVFNATSPANTTVPSGYTSLMNLGYSTPTTGLRVASDDSGITNATVTWGGTSATIFASLALELDTSTTHDTTGALTGPGSTIAGTAAHVAVHATTGALTGPGSEVVGSATRFRAFDTSGALTGPGSEVVGSADRTGGTVTHATTGALTGAGSSVSGSAARTREHATTGALTGPGSSVAGTAVHQALHTTTGALTGPGSTVAGSAARTRVHATSGVLSGAGATVAGAAARTRAHATSGVLTGPGSSIAGTAQHNTPHATSGALVGPGSEVVGAASRSGAIIDHATSGALTGPGALVSGAAARSRVHEVTGVLVGPGSVVAGAAARTRVHEVTGALVGPGSTIVGSAARERIHGSSGALTGPGAALAGVAARSGAVQLCMTLAQAQKLYEIWLLHGLGTPPLVVGPTARSAGALAQTVTEAGEAVTIQTVTGADPVDIDVGQMVDELAALHGLDGTSLTVTPTTRSAGAITQTLTLVGDVTTVTRQ